MMPAQYGGTPTLTNRYQVYPNYYGNAVTISPQDIPAKPPRTFAHDVPLWYEYATDLPPCSEYEELSVPEYWEVSDYDIDSSNISLRSVSTNQPRKPRPVTSPPDDPELAIKGKPLSSPRTKRKSYSPSLLRRSFFNRQSKSDLTSLEEKCAGCGFPVTDDRRVSVRREADRRDVYHATCFKCSQCDTALNLRSYKLLDSGSSSRHVAEKFGVSKTQVLQTRKRKVEYLTEYEDNAPAECKRKIRKTGNEEINNLLWQWFKDATSRNISVTGPMLQEKSLSFAKDLGNDEFKVSNGWLESFLKRHNIVFGVMSGESGDVDNSVVTDWKAKLPELCKDYDPRDIYNMDESGLFFRDTINKSFHTKGDDCNGGKRITISLCANMLGEKEHVLVIGKSVKPRCFRNLSTSQLPVSYYNNKKAWMTSAIFEDWLKSFDRKMRRQGRNVLLFLDNALSHPKLTYKNVKLCFLPPNITSKSQPMDQGIIQAVKLRFRKRQLQYVLTQMEKEKTLTGSQLLKQITILDAIYWINHAWQDLDPQTIVKCFNKAEFIPQETNDTSDEQFDDYNNVPISVIKLSQDLFGVYFSELCDIDNEIQTSDISERDWNASANSLLSELENEEKDDNSEDEDDVPPTAPVTLSEVQSCLSRMRDFALQRGIPSLLTNIMDMDTEISVLATNYCTQTMISDFFK